MVITAFADLGRDKIRGWTFVNELSIATFGMLIAWDRLGQHVDWLISRKDPKP